MPGQRRLWDSNVVISYLAGHPGVRDACSNIISKADQGELEIVVSAMATIEVAYLSGMNDQTSEMLIREFFDRDYIIPVAIDVRVAAIARGLVRKYRGGPSLKPPDAAHLATAIQWKIPVLKTTDPDLLRLNGREGTPLVTIREPLFEGPFRMAGL